jgi:hypothetical protein
MLANHEITNEDLAAEAWQDWAEEQGDLQEAIERRRADARRVEAEAAEAEAQAARYNRWLMQSAFRDVNYLLVDLGEEN